MTRPLFTLFKLFNELLCGGNKFILLAVRGGVAVQKNIGSIKEDAMQDGTNHTSG